MANLESLCEAVLKTQAARDAAKANLEHADKAYDDAQAALAKAMVDIGQDKATFGDKNFATKQKVTWEQVASRKDEVLRLLKAEAPEVVKESVHASTLSKFMSDKDAEFGSAGPDWWKTLREGVERRESTVLSITKKK